MSGDDGVSRDDHTDHSPVELAVEVFVYLPLGMALELPRALPRFIERGRREVAGWTGHGPRVTGSPLDRIRTDAAGAARGLARRRDGGDERPSGAAPEPATPSPDTNAGAPAEGTAAADVVTPPAAPTAPAGPAPDPDGLAIPDYDSLSASQVVRRLDGLASDELDAVRRYEEATRGRRTILSKVAQLQAG